MTVSATHDTHFYNWERTPQRSLSHYPKPTRNWEYSVCVCVCLCVSETLNGERDTFAKNVATFRRSDPLEESIDDRRDRPMIDRRWIEDLTLGLIRN